MAFVSVYLQQIHSFGMCHTTLTVRWLPRIASNYQILASKASDFTSLSTWEYTRILYSPPVKTLHGLFFALARCHAFRHSIIPQEVTLGYRYLFPLAQPNGFEPLQIVLETIVLPFTLRSAFWYPHRDLNPDLVIESHTC